MRPWLFLALVACGTNAPTTTQSQSSGLSAPINVFLSNETYRPISSVGMSSATGVFVTIERIDAKPDTGAWITVVDPELPKTVNLMALQNEPFASLGLAQFPAGAHVQLRLITAEGGPNYVLTGDGVKHPLMVPSGSQSGIKVFGDFNIDPCVTGKVSIYTESIQVEPPGTKPHDMYILRPVIRIREVVLEPGTCVTIE